MFDTVIDYSKNKVNILDLRMEKLFLIAKLSLFQAAVLVTFKTADCNKYNKRGADQYKRIIKQF